MAQGPFLRKYGVAAVIPFDLYEVDGVDFRIDAAHTTGDSKIMKDEGVDTADTANAFVDEGATYSISLSTAEMSAARIKVILRDVSTTKVWLDTAIYIETYGNASAQHAFDLDTASFAQTGDSFTRLGTPTNANISADINFVQFAIDTDLITGGPINVSAGAVIEVVTVTNQMTPTAVGNAVLDQAMVETPGAPAITGTFRAAWEWIFALSRNKVTQTATVQTLRNNADGVDLATASVSDDGSVYTRGKWST